MQTSDERKEAEVEEVAGVVVGTDVTGEESKEKAVNDTGVQIGPGGEEVKEEQLDENVGLELGDFIEVHSNRADIETVKGLIYYIDETRISILEEGKSRKLVVFNMEPDEDGVPSFLEEYELTGIDIKEKRLLPSFVAQRGMAKDLQVETFDEEGEALATYVIKTVDEERDTAVFVDTAGEELTLDFAFKGIPKDRSVAPFDVLRVIEPPKLEPTVPNEAAQGEVEEMLEFEFLEDLEAPEVEDELSGIVQAIQKPLWEMIYKEDEQINDMLRERIREMDPAAQRSTKRIRAVTRLVWNMLALRNDITRYKGDVPVGRKPVTYETLVDLLEKTEFPLAKKVLDVRRAIYIDHSSGHYVPLTDPEHKDDPTEVADPQIKLDYLQDVIEKSTRYIEAQLREGLVEVEVPGALAMRKIPRWITIWQGYYNKYFVTMLPIREDGDLKDLKHDTDFFRFEIPMMEEDAASTISGLPVLDVDRDARVDESYLKKVSFSYMRGLGPRYGRYGEGGLSHKIEDADAAEVKGFLLFPLQFIRDLGYTRSGILVNDVVHALIKPKPMRTILNEAKTIVDIPESDKIISVRFDGSTLGNIEIADWLKGQAIYGGGIGDLMPVLRSYGLLQAEFTLAQKMVLDSKIALYRSAVKKMIAESREKIVELFKSRKPIQTFQLLPAQSAHELFALVAQDSTGEPILKQLLKDFVVRHPSYSKDDITKFAYMYVYYPDLLINTLAQNPEVAKERLRAERDIFIQEVLDKIATDKKLEDRGDPPRPNPCQHVKDLKKVRDIPDNTQRMMAMNKFVTMYKLKKENHWLWCNNGEPPHHLICEHEYLLLQEFLRPKEKDVIHKEIILTFSGGKFNGQYICKQCGQPIQEFEYDINTATDDNGRPLDGRNVLVDEDAIEEEKLLRAVTAESEDTERVETKSEDEVKIYRVIAELASLVGIFPDRKSYETMITRVKNAFNLAPDRAKYAQSQRQLKKAGKPSTDYDVFISRILVSLCAAALLIDVQTHIPEYVVRYTLAGCAAPEFTGYPRDPDARKPDTGMEYLACAISSITHRTEPWASTGYQTISSSTSRLKEILTYVKSFTEQLAETPDVQQSIIDKKQYLLETFGYETALGRPKDIIPYGFTPAPFIPTKELAAEAESPVIAESASDAEKVRAYIKQAHIYALKFGKYSAGSGISETSCCYTDLSKPAAFWNAKENLPALPPAEPPKGTTGSSLYVRMKPRALERIFGKADASIMYRLFLRVCFRGPRKGQQHEPGYDNICPWCEFVFPEDPRLPPPTLRYSKDSNKQKKFDEEYASELKAKEATELAGLREAGLDEITSEMFEDVLQSVNRRSIIPALGQPIVPTPIENIRGTLSLLPRPFEDFEEVIRTTIVNLEGLTNDSTRTDVIAAFNELSTRTQTLENEIRTRLGDSNFVYYQAMVKLAPQELGEALRGYFLVPFQRILNFQELSPEGFTMKLKPSRTKEFEGAVVEDIKEAFKRHTSYLNEIIRDIPKTDLFVKAKVNEVVERLSVVVPFFIKILRPTVVRGGQVASIFLQRCITAGIFAEFINPNHIPANATGVTAPRSVLTSPAKIPARILQACILKYNNEGLNFSQEQIREMIQDRIEKEKSKIMRDKSDMTPEQRKLDNMLQRLGMGKWAVGGTKAIWRYDPNQYVSEKDAMEAAGITRFGPQEDVYERDGGYDVVQTGEDDA
jgi:hypothetical protein